MAHAQKPDFVFRRNGRVYLNRRRRQISQLLAAKVCASAVVMLDTPCSEVVWRVLTIHSIHQFPLHFPSRASPCAITFQLDSTQHGKEVVTEHCTQNEWCCNHVINTPCTMHLITDKLYTPIFVHNSFIKYKVLKKIQNFSNVTYLKGSEPWHTDYCWWDHITLRTFPVWQVSNLILYNKNQLHALISQFNLILKWSSMCFG